MELLTLEDRKPVYKAIKFDGSKSCIDGILTEFSTDTKKLIAVQAITDLFAKDSETNITCVKLAHEGEYGNIELHKGMYIIQDENHTDMFGVVKDLGPYTVTKTETVAVDEETEDELPYDPATAAAKLAAKKLEGLRAASVDVNLGDPVSAKTVPPTLEELGLPTHIPGTSDTLDIPIGN